MLLVLFGGGYTVASTLLRWEFEGRKAFKGADLRVRPFLYVEQTSYGTVTDDIAYISLLDIYLLDMLGKKTGKGIDNRNGTATPDALLGLLSMAPMSGYDMRTVISQSIGHFWSESFGQIYPALKRLTAEGFVEKKTERQKGRPGQACVFTDRGGTRPAREMVDDSSVG